MKNKRNIFQNILFSICDSHFGMLGAYLFNKKPVATAHLEYELLENLKPNVKYTIFAHCTNKIKRNVLIDGYVYDD